MIIHQKILILRDKFKTNENAYYFFRTFNHFFPHL